MAYKFDKRDPAFYRLRRSFNKPDRAWYMNIDSNSNDEDAPQTPKKRTKKSAREWTTPIIITGFDISPAKYYQVCNFVEPLIARVGLHQKDMGGYRMKFLKSDIAEELTRKFKLFVDNDAMHFWKHDTLYGFITQIASEMGENWDAAKEESIHDVYFINQPGKAFKKNDPSAQMPLRFCEFLIHYANDPTVHPPTVKLNSFCSILRESGMLDYENLSWGKFTKQHLWGQDTE
jgi:hypothetical protein